MVAMLSTSTLSFEFYKRTVKDQLRHTMLVEYEGLLSFKELKDYVYPIL